MISVSIEESESASSPSVRLTRREIEILGLVAQGYPSKEAAEILFVSKRTVDFHLSNIYTKLKAGNRVKALRNAERLGLIPYDPTAGKGLWELL